MSVLEVHSPEAFCQWLRAASGDRHVHVLTLSAGQTNACNLRTIPIKEPQMQAIGRESASGDHVNRNSPRVCGTWVDTG